MGFSEQEVTSAIQSHNTFFFEGIAAKAIDQIQSGNQAVRKIAGDLLTARHPSQLYEAGLEGLLLFILIIIARRIWAKNGVASSVFLVAYPIVRILGEQFRMPDAQLGFQLFGLTRGQWISIFMLAIGITYTICICLRNKTSDV